eukprot:Sdes_comp18294_c0_seq2m7986
MVLENSIEAAQTSVDALYEIRDDFLKNYSIEEISRKEDILKQKLTTVVSSYIEPLYHVEPYCGGKDKDKMSLLYFLHGKALNVLESYSKECQELLSKSVKLNPQNHECWNELGECFWKNGAVDLALNCFEGAMKQCVTKVSYRNISMALRKKASLLRQDKTYFESCYPDLPMELLAKTCSQLVFESLAKAKAALQLDIQDGMSWYVLGNAHLTCFFASDFEDGKQTHDFYHHLQSALKSFFQAEKDPKMKYYSDLYHSRGLVYEYQQNFSEAIANFSQSSILQGNQSNDYSKEQQIFEFISNIANLISKKGNIKQKRLTLARESLVEISSSIQLYYQTSEGAKCNYQIVSLKDLQPGLNNGKAVVACVIHVPSKTLSTGQ